MFQNILEYLHILVWYFPCILTRTTLYPIILFQFILNLNISISAASKTLLQQAYVKKVVIYFEVSDTRNCYYIWSMRVTLMSLFAHNIPNYHNFMSLCRVTATITQLAQLQQRFNMFLFVLILILFWEAQRLFPLALWFIFDGEKKKNQNNPPHPQIISPCSCRTY